MVFLLLVSVLFYLTVTKLSISIVITPHAQRERGKVIDRGVHMSVVEKNILIVL